MTDEKPIEAEFFMDTNWFHVVYAIIMMAVIWKVLELCQ